jgi:hypothetical protein
LQASIRALLPTPTARGYRDGRASAATHDRNARPLNEAITPIGHEGPALLSPELHEWMMGFPSGWGLPNGPGLAGAEPRAWTDPLPRERWLTREKHLRRLRLTGTGNAVVVQVGEIIARDVLASMGAA